MTLKTEPQNSFFYLFIIFWQKVANVFEEFQHYSVLSVKHHEYIKYNLNGLSYQFHAWEHFQVTFQFVLYTKVRNRKS